MNQSYPVDEIEAHEFEGGWGGICGRDWREEREGRNVIKIQSQNKC